MARRRTQPQTEPQALAAQTDPPEPGDRGPNVLWISTRQAGVTVTEDTALTLGAVWACVRVIAETLAAMPWQAFEARPGGGRLRAADDPADALLHSRANPETPAFFWRETLLAHALTWGNGYAEIERDMAGRPAALWQLTPERVCPERDGRGRLYYDVSNERGPNVALPPEDVYHLRGLGYDGLVGYSVVRMAARAIGLGIALEETAARFSENDSTPGGLLKHPTRLDERARTNLRDSWNRIHQGPSKRRTVAILEEGMSWEQTGLPPEDAQLLESRQFTPAEICRWFRVPPHKIHDLTRATFSNIEHQSIDFVVDTLLPWATRLEAEADAKLFPLLRRGRRFSRINLLGLLRGDSTARAAFYTALFDRGILSINDVREKEDMNPIGPDGDKRFVPMNMQLLEKAGMEPEPDPEPEPMPEMPEEPEKPGMDLPAAQMRAALAPVLEEAVGRVERRAAHRLAEARKRVGEDAAALAAWRESFLPEHLAYARAALGPGARSLAALAGGRPTDADTAVEVYLAGRARAWGQDLPEPETSPQASLLAEQVLAASAAGRVTQAAPLAGGAPAVTLAPTINIHVPEQPAPQVTLHVPPQPAPDVTLNVPQQPPATVNLTVDVPPPRRRATTKTVERDAEGEIVRVHEEECEHGPE